MSKDFIEIEGFKELEKKLKSLSSDKVKNREVRKLLGQVANSTVRVARDLAPKSKKAHTISGKTRATRTFQPGNLKKSIGKKNLTRANNPMLVVRANSRKSADGFYGRQFLTRGTKKGNKLDANPFMQKAYDQTKGNVSADAEAKVAKYIQRQIDRLSK